jgi:4-amino-4-deoxychorismate lyase
MCLLIETLCFENGDIQRLEFHNERMNRTRFDLFNCSDKINIGDFIQIPEKMLGAKVKCRIVYSIEIISVEYENYIIKPVNSLKLLFDDGINYQYKFLDRKELVLLLGLRENADDILIVKNNQITDTSYANIIFRKDAQWFTPSQPLLPGTRREFYIRSGIVIPIEIRPEDLSDYEDARIINAMISIEESAPITIDKIYF